MRNWTTEWGPFLRFCAVVGFGALLASGVAYVTRGWVLNVRDRRRTRRQVVQLMSGGRGHGWLSHPRRTVVDRTPNPG